MGNTRNVSFHPFGSHIKTRFGQHRLAEILGALLSDPAAHATDTPSVNQVDK